MSGDQHAIFRANEPVDEMALQLSKIRIDTAFDTKKPASDTGTREL